MKQFKYLLWPPAEAAHTNRALFANRKTLGTEVLWSNTLNAVREAVSRYDQGTTAVTAYANEVASSEAKRKETIEAKAASVAQTAGLAVSVFALLPATLGKTLPIPFWWLIFLGVILCVSITHLLISLYYAIRCRKVQDYVMPCVDTFIDVTKAGLDNSIISEIAAQKLAEAKWNEDALVAKANYLVVSEDMLFRGIACFASFVILSTILLGAYSWLDIQP